MTDDDRPRSAVHAAFEFLDRTAAVPDEQLGCAECRGERAPGSTFCVDCKTRLLDETPREWDGPEVDPGNVFFDPSLQRAYDHVNRELFTEAEIRAAQGQRMAAAEEARVERGRRWGAAIESGAVTRRRRRISTRGRVHIEEMPVTREVEIPEWLADWIGRVIVFNERRFRIDMDPDSGRLRLVDSGPA